MILHHILSVHLISQMTNEQEELFSHKGKKWRAYTPKRGNKIVLYMEVAQKIVYVPQKWVIFHYALYNPQDSSWGLQNQPPVKIMQFTSLVYNLPFLLNLANKSSYIKEIIWYHNLSTLPIFSNGDKAESLVSL